MPGGSRRGRPHAIRLTLAAADPAAARARLDAILARPALTLSERNLFTGERMQIAADLDDLARLALRRPYCIAYDGLCDADDFREGHFTLDRGAHGEWLGFGADARALIDRLPLADRIALSRNPRIPRALRLDLALTGFARAAQLRDDRAIAALAADLAGLLPAMRRDWQGIAAARSGPARRFAIAFAMAKLPGLRPNLAGYTRPEGTIRSFQGYWVDWLIVPRGQGVSPSEPPPASAYIHDSDWYMWDDSAANDTLCVGDCGLGAFPIRLPPFAAAGRARAAAERAASVIGTDGHDFGARELPRGTISLWEEALAGAAARPGDPRSPEMLYWLIHVARWGGNHDHLGRRAFRLLHTRYPESAWARRSPYYYDD
jgi:hypothetical protein